MNMMLTPNTNTIPFKKNVAGLKASMFVDELIWGHRFYDEQTAEMTLLEFLNVAGINGNSKLFDFCPRSLILHQYGNSVLLHALSRSL